MKNVLITGGNKGIGREVTRLFIQSEYRIYVIARDFSEFEFSSHANVEKIQFDLINTTQIPKLVSGLDGIDILINNAGIMHSLPYDDYPRNKIEQSLKLNIEAPVTLITEISKHMINQKQGRIVNNASIAGEIGHPDHRNAP